jgi:class 3 adenylate cyclase
MALFGVPRAHDDDPSRATRAALIHEAIDRLSEKKMRQLRIASGEVVAGTLERANVHDYTVLGHSVNMAARLVATAGPGHTLLSGAVYQALSGRAICDVLSEIPLKGFDTPTLTHSVSRAGSRQPQRLRRPQSRTGSFQKLDQCVYGAPQRPSRLRAW